MNRTNFEHGLFAVLIMALLWSLSALLGVTQGQWVGAAAGIAFFAGREFTQAQRGIAKTRCITLTQLSWYAALDLRQWSRDGILDLLVPLLVCLLIAGLVPLWL